LIFISAKIVTVATQVAAVGSVVSTAATTWIVVRF
jgi:hypothetical protein